MAERPLRRRRTTETHKDGLRLDQPREARRAVLRRPHLDPEVFGRVSERFARFMGTAQFLVYMTGVVLLWLIWNTFSPRDLQFDPRALNYTLLTLILSLQASYAAPLILLAQNRQADRDRVSIEQDRARDERGLADTEYLTREVAALRMALGETATRDFVRSELRTLLEEMELRALRIAGDPSHDATGSAPVRHGSGAQPAHPARPDPGGTDRVAERPAERPEDHGTHGTRRRSRERPATRADPEQAAAGTAHTS